MFAIVVFPLQKREKTFPLPCLLPTLGVRSAGSRDWQPPGVTSGSLEIRTNPPLWPCTHRPTCVVVVPGTPWERVSGLCSARNGMEWAPSEGGWNESSFSLILTETNGSSWKAGKTFDLSLSLGILTFPPVKYRRLYICMFIRMTDTDVLHVFGLQPQFLAHSSLPPGNFLRAENTQCLLLC